MKKALLLIDIQNEVARLLKKRSLEKESFIDRVVELASLCPRADIPVFHITTEFTDDCLPLLNLQREKRVCWKGTTQAEEIDELRQLASKDGHISIIKNHYDAFPSVP